MSLTWRGFNYKLLQLDTVENSYEVWLIIPHLGDLLVGRVWYVPGDRQWDYEVYLVAGMDRRDLDHVDVIGCGIDTRKGTIQLMLNCVAGTYLDWEGNYVTN